MRKTHNSSVIFRVALVLFCLVLFSAHLTSGIFAKYKFEGDQSNSARPAKPAVSVSSAMAAPVIASDGTAAYDFTVENTGEVSIRYSLVVCLAPDSVTSYDADTVFSNAKIDGVPGVYDDTDHTYIFANVGELEGDTANHTLTFDTNDFLSVSDTVGSPVNTWKDVTVLIAVKTEQID